MEIYQFFLEIMQCYLLVLMVMMDWVFFDGDSDLIQDNLLFGGDMVIQYLIDQGYLCIVCIVGLLDKILVCLCFEGYYVVMVCCGLLVVEGYVVISDFEFGGGFSVMQQLLVLLQCLQVVFVGNDVMVVGVYQVLYQVGLLILQDMVLVGYDDIELVCYMMLLLIIIYQLKDELGELVIDVLIYCMVDLQ